MSTGYSHTPKLPRSLFYLTLGLAIRMDCFYPRTLYPDLELRLAPPGWAQTQVAPKPGLSQERHLNPAAITPAQVEKKGQNLSGRPNMLAPLPESIPLNPPSQSMPHTLIMVSLIFSDSRGKGSREVVWWAPSLFLERRQDQREILLHFWKKSSEDVSSSKNREDVSSSKNTLICDPPSVTAIPILSESRLS